MNAFSIGGFFEKHEPDGKGPSVLESWTEGRPYAAFVNARSALAALAAMNPKGRVWLPAFLCADMAQAVAPNRLRFYPVGEGFEPDLSAVEAQAGDIVLVVAYFGLPVGTAVRDFAARRPDVQIVEDRAQALGPSDFGHWRLYSPRKLLGVADGGLLVGGGTSAPTQTSAAETLWTAPLLRAADRDGRNNAVWHAANQAKEAAMAVTDQAITPLSLSILSSTSLESLAGPRLRNWRALDRRLRAWSALPTDPAAPPLGYVLRLHPAGRTKMLRGLHAERIFAAVHWPHLAAPAQSFPREHRWTRELVTLPCDHRYSEKDMDRISAVVLGLLR